jgi:poly-gamma-glutamate capsule biosynthesis protein CapA/YwtB (metallophosphatase superfamily)
MWPLLGSRPQALRILATTLIVATLWSGCRSGAGTDTGTRPSTRPSTRPGTVTVTIGGDVLLGRGVAKRAQTIGWKSLLRGVAPTLRRADLAIVNLESPLAKCLAGGTLRQPRLCGPPQGLTALRAAGIDGVTLANNHALDAGPTGLRRTAQLLRKAKIVPLGVQAALTGRPRAERLGPITVVAVNLTRVAHAPGASVPIPTPSALSKIIREARQRAPRQPVLLIAHLGREYHRYPGPRERAYGRAAVTAGVSAIAFHGAHVRRALVHDRRVPVHLGLGNLLFDQRDPRTHVGALFTVRLKPIRLAPHRRPAVALPSRCVNSHSGNIVRCP